jgi:hypothetical protein
LSSERGFSILKLQMSSNSFELSHLPQPSWLISRQSLHSDGRAYLFSIAGIYGDGDAGIWKWRSLLIICKELLGSRQGDDAITSTGTTSWLWQGH